MRTQTTDACGPNALHNALYCLDKDISQEKLEKLAGTTKEGTNEHALIAVASRYSAPLAFSTADSLSALAQLRGHLAAGATTLLCVDGHDHWVAIIGVCGSRLVLVDGAVATSDALTRVVSGDSLALRWRSEDGMYYGIALYRKARR